MEILVFLLMFLIAILSRLLMEKCLIKKGMKGFNLDTKRFIIYLFGVILFSCLGVLGLLLYGISYNLFVFLIIIYLVYVISMTDFKYYIIFDEYLVISLILFFILKLSYFGIREALLSLLTGFILFLFLFLIKLVGDYFYNRESLGFGDIKLCFLIGYVLGLKLGFVTLVCSALLAFPYALLSFVKDKEKEIPFGPFLILGMFFVFLFSDQLSNLILLLESI